MWRLRPPAHPDRGADRVRRRLDRALARLGTVHLRRLGRQLSDARDVSAEQVAVLTRLATVRRRLRATPHHADLIEEVRCQRGGIVRLVATMAPDALTMQLWFDVLRVLNAAAVTLDGAGPGDTPVRVCRVPAVLLWELHQRLMPPERMVLIAGRRAGHDLVLTAGFDVTAANASAVHVQADRARMAAALLAMEQSGTELAAWVHSHPGAGQGATRPSHIDTRQAADWAADFPGLLAGIVTADRWWRFWGPACDHGVELRVEGPGAVAAEGEDHVYHLE